MGEVASEGCSPSLWAGAESPVAGAVRSGRPKRYIVTVRAIIWKVVINLESGVSPPFADKNPVRTENARNFQHFCVLTGVDVVSSVCAEPDMCPLASLVSCTIMRGRKRRCGGFSADRGSAFGI